MRKMVDFFINQSQWIIVIGGLITILGTYFAYLKTEKSSAKTDFSIEQSKELVNKNIELSQENNNLNIANKELLQQNLDYAKIQKELSDRNIELTKEVNDNAKKINEFVTGGTSYCFFEMGFPEKPSLNLHHVGNFPLRNVEIQIQDLSRRVFLIKKLANNDYHSPLIWDIAKQTTYQLSYPSLYPNTVISDITIPIEQGQEDISLWIWIYLENGTINERLEIKNFKNKKTRKYTYEVKRDDKILKSGN